MSADKKKCLFHGFEAKWNQKWEITIQKKKINNRWKRSFNASSIWFTNHCWKLREFYFGVFGWVAELKSSFYKTNWWTDACDSSLLPMLCIFCVYRLKLNLMIPLRGVSLKTPNKLKKVSNSRSDRFGFEYIFKIWNQKHFQILARSKNTAHDLCDKNVLSRYRMVEANVWTFFFRVCVYEKGHGRKENSWSSAILLLPKFDSRVQWFGIR